MGKIKQLPVFEAQKIAAGEVVERPANALKELLENSIDAGASEITVYLQDGGKQLIRVIDNGTGMCYEDACMSIIHHATSKINSVNDLATLTTFGFRGEALSSMCSVSKVELKTKQEIDNTGIVLNIEDGKIISERKIACNTGTDVTLKELFYNVPARRKFLKTTATEYRNCAQLFQVLALAYPSIKFQLYHNSELVYNCPIVLDITQRAAQIFDYRVVQSLLNISSNDGTLSLTGTISNHHYARYDRNAIITLVNKRWVKNHKLSQAILKGYCNVLPPARYPTSIIDITIDTELIDINVHPKKEEVQFLHPVLVEQAVERAIKQVLQDSIVPSRPVAPVLPAIKLQESQGIKNFRTEFSNSLFSDFESRERESRPNIIENSYAFNNILEQSFSKPIQSKNPEQDSVEPSNNKNIEKNNRDLSDNYILLGQLHKTYIILQTHEGLLLIDQHAAHEAILFEKLSNRFEAASVVNLMFPSLISLSSSDFELIMNHQIFFKEQGIEFEAFGHNQIRITGTPVHAKSLNIQELIKEMIALINEYETVDKQELYKLISKKAHAMMACKAAIKAGDTLNTIAMEQLIGDLYALEHRLTCPHGRPTSWLVSLYEIEKKFKRVR